MDRVGAVFGFHDEVVGTIAGEQDRDNEACHNQEVPTGLIHLLIGI